MIFDENFEILNKESLNSMFMQISNKSQQEKFFKNKELDFGLTFLNVRFRVNAF
jgi:Tfp pilus assembly pilus retraction ATPase PilT